MTPIATILADKPGAKFRFQQGTCFQMSGDKAICASMLVQRVPGSRPRFDPRPAAPDTEFHDCSKLRVLDCKSGVRL